MTDNAEIERLRAYNKIAHREIDRMIVEISALKAEIERLTKQRDEAHDYRVAMENSDAQTIVGLRAEIERLRADIKALSRTLNGLANRSDFADKVMGVARRAPEPKSFKE